MSIETEAETHLAKLVRMANQIATAFRAYPAAEAEANTAEHIGKFWNRVMRTELNAHIAAGADGVSPVVVAAMARVKA